MRNTLCLLSLFILTSCIKEIPISLTGSNHQVVITGLICPDSPISLNISNLRAFNDTLKATPANILEVSVMEDGLSVGHPMVSGLEIQTGIYPKEGSEYELVVRTDAETITTKTKIPAKLLIVKADFWVTDFASQKGDHLLVLSTSWEDPPSEVNYYELMILEESKIPYSRYRYDEIDDPVLLQEGDLEYEPSSFVLSDKQFDGDTITIQLKYSITLRPETYQTKYASLRSISEEYYHFKKSWYRHRYLQNTSLNVDRIREDYNIIPLLFQGDPVPLYSNIHQAFGIFAGLSQDVRKFKLVK